MSEQLKRNGPLITKFPLISGFAYVEKIFAVNSLLLNFTNCETNKNNSIRYV